MESGRESGRFGAIEDTLYRCNARQELRRSKIGWRSFIPSCWASAFSPAFRLQLLASLCKGRFYSAYDAKDVLQSPADASPRPEQAAAVVDAHRTAASNVKPNVCASLKW